MYGYSCHLQPPKYHTLQFGIRAMNNSNIQINPETKLNHLANPYFIQPGEGMSFLLVLDLLMTENYLTWARTMRSTLNIKKKLSFIDDKITKPTDTSNRLFIP